MTNIPEAGPPVVSVVIPSHEYGHYLPMTLDSVRQQTLRAWECIIVDDGSTDDTVEVAEKAVVADSRFRLVRRSACRLAEARNTGIGLSTGRYVQFLDADDLLEADKLQDHADFLDQHADVDVVYGDATYFQNERPQRQQRALRSDDDWMPRVSGGVNEVLPRLVEGNVMVVNAALVRRSTLDRVAGFDPDLGALEDWDLWIRCANSGARFEYRAVPGTRAVVRAHDQSMSRDLGRMLTSTLRVRSSIGPLLRDEELRRRNRALLLATEARLGVLQGLNGELRSGLGRLIRAAAAGRRPVWWMWAVVLPLAAQSFMRPFVRRLRPELVANAEVNR